MEQFKVIFWNMDGTLFFVPTFKNMIKIVFSIMFFLIGGTKKSGTKNNLPYILYPLADNINIH